MSTSIDDWTDLIKRACATDMLPELESILGEAESLGAAPGDCVGDKDRGKVLEGYSRLIDDRLAELGPDSPLASELGALRELVFAS